MNGNENPDLFHAPMDRPEVPGTGDERTALARWLDWHRATLLRKLDGLSEEQLRRAVLPTGLSLLGLVKHLTDVEQGWFVLDFAGGDEPPIYSGGEPGAEFRVSESAGEIVGQYLRMCSRAREIVATESSLDITVPNVRRGAVDLRWILLHMIEETARHNGHADVIRELIDGRTGW
ncbi:DinB family protein [Amycolatopsis sp. NPDC005232]|uniref:DinB family protein n=1 Tax=Amycolatopsis sp. NPDC005232 TaxID=3157027 RepID=UPI0033B635E1